MGIHTSEHIHVIESAFSSIIGQERAIAIMKFALKHNRHVLLIGPPGTGKSMLAKEVSKILPKPDVKMLARPNPVNPEQPIVFFVPKTLDIAALKLKYIKYVEPIDEVIRLVKNVFTFIAVGTSVLSIVLNIFKIETPIRAIEAMLKPLLKVAVGVAFNMYLLKILYRPKAIPVFKTTDPKILELISADVLDEMKTNFISAGCGGWQSKFGTVLHDPLKGMDMYEGTTTAHKFLVPGAVHKAHKGVLYFDEIGNLNSDEQYVLLTIIEDKKYEISGRQMQNGGGGTNTHITTNPVDCDFRLILAGNYETIKVLHPALRSRIRGYGYEVYMNDFFDVNEENFKKVLQFFAQEVKRHNLLHLSQDAIAYLTQLLILESGFDNKFTLKLRDFSGYISAASDIAKANSHKYIELADLRDGVYNKQSIETQKFMRYSPNLQNRYAKSYGVVNTFARLKTATTFGNITSFTYKIIQLHYAISVTISKSLIKQLNILFPHDKSDIEYVMFSNRFNILTTGDYIPEDSLVSVSCDIDNIETLPKYSDMALAVCVAVYSAKVRKNVPNSYIIIGNIDAQGYVQNVSDLQFKIDELEKSKSFVSHIICSSTEKVTSKIKLEYISHISEIYKLSCFETSQINFFESINHYE